MEQIELLIEKFWEGKASLKEKDLLAELLLKHEQELTNSMQEVFFQFRKQRHGAENKQKVEQMLQQLHERIKPETSAVLPGKLVNMKSFAGRWVAAAVILVVITTAALFIQRTIHQPITQEQLTLTDGTFRTFTNTSDTIQTLTLQDGSVASLYGNSQLSYPEPFEQSSRSIQLSGKAMFHVAKDSKRPFIVITGNVITTALGTTFTVNTLSPNIISVLLHEGKVMIKARDSAQPSMKDQVILIPGQLFSLNTTSCKYHVQKAPKEQVSIDVRTEVQGTKKKKEEFEEIFFNNESLAVVLKHLARVYKTELRFNEHDVKGLYFTGDIQKSDSLHTVLTAICNTNSLIFTQKKNHIQIKQSN